MTELIYAWLSHSWSGFLVAAFAALVFWLLVRLLRWFGWGWARWIGYGGYAIAGLMTLAAIYGTYRIESLEGKYQPPGRMVEVNGLDMHILAEGENRGNPTVVWVPGGHGGGLGMHNFHKVFRQETRSILFDRPGSGWSEVSYPRRTATEVEELNLLLGKAGESGPYVFVGHSYGGLFAANYARRYPDEVAAIVLLDPTHPEFFFYAPRENFASLTLGGILGAIAKLFGVQQSLEDIADQSEQGKRLVEHYKRELGDVLDIYNASEAGPRSTLAMASILSEMSFKQAAGNSFKYIVYDGELGDKPVYLVTPGDANESFPKDPQKRKEAGDQLWGIEGKDLDRLESMFNRTRERYLAISTRSQHIITPNGTGHNFPYERPDVVVNTVRKPIGNHER